MKHLNYGNLDSVDEYGQADVFGVIPLAEEKAPNKLGKGVRSNVIEIRRHADQPEKLTLNIKRFFPGPISQYNSPFTKDEASQVLTNAGLDNVEVLGTYLSGWPGCEYYEPFGTSQVILLRQSGQVAELYLQYLKKEDIRKIVENRKADLYLKCSRIKPFWHVVGARKIILV